MVFPHLYGPLPVETVISVTAYLPDAEGSFAPYQGLSSSATKASASISTTRSGEISADTWTIVATGRISPNTSAWTAPISRHREMSVTKMRVRTTSAMGAHLVQRDLDPAQRFPGLGCRTVARCGGSCHHDVRAGAYRTRIADRGFELRA